MWVWTGESGNTVKLFDQPGGRKLLHKNGAFNRPDYDSGLRPGWSCSRQNNIFNLCGGSHVHRVSVSAADLHWPGQQSGCCSSTDIRLRFDYSICEMKIQSVALISNLLLRHILNSSHRDVTKGSGFQTDSFMRFISGCMCHLQKYFKMYMM